MSGFCPNDSSLPFTGLFDADERKTAALAGADRGPSLEHRPDGSIRISGFQLASQILRGEDVRQAGFNAELVRYLPLKNLSILFKTGADHRRQRAAVARFFAPAVVKGRYRRLMTDLSGRLVQNLIARGHAKLDDMSLDLSIAVAAEIVGLTDSLRPGLGARLNRFFSAEGGTQWFRAPAFVARALWDLLLVYLLDVRPAIRSRRRVPREDLISHLVAQGWSHLDILTECITYATAGMSTTREFIVVAAWHLLERDDLRLRFLGSDEVEKAAILEEILRLEPAVGTLFRRADRNLTLQDKGCPVEIPANTLLAIDLRGVNADETTVGGCPYKIDPARSRGGPALHMSFGDGPHRCPGAAVAIQETSIFLDQLLRVPGLRLTSVPTAGWNSMTVGYVLRDAVVTVG